MYTTISLLLALTPAGGGVSGFRATETDYTTAATFVISGVSGEPNPLIVARRYTDMTIAIRYRFTLTEIELFVILFNLLLARVP